MRTLWDQMAEPKWCIAVGNCASAGGPFPTYSVVQGIDEVVPVDIYIPGCPPNPEAIFYGILKLQEKVQQQTIARTTDVVRESGARG
jgi:NADH-quinone oxidoreductase subunit B